MGSGYTMRCTACEHKMSFYLGVGFNYPEMYEATMKAAANGKLGVIFKEVLEENPNAAIDPALVIIRCRKCNYIDSAQKLSMHLPKPGYDRNSKKKVMWCSAKPYYDIDYVSPGDFRENYYQLTGYDHICPKCSEAMDVIGENRLDRVSFYCPDCGGKMDVCRDMMWD